MNFDEVFSIWDRFERSNVTKFSLKTKDCEILFKKGGYEGTQSGKNTDVFRANTAGDNDNREKDASAPEISEKGTIVKAQFVGTFYSSSAPGAEPFIKIGQRVKKGDVIAIIEAMKLMNEIVSPVDGTVTDIYVGDETLVEYGQALVCIGE